MTIEQVQDTVDDELESTTEAIEAEESGDNDSGDAPQVSEHEERASRMGWVPKDKFRGNPDTWVSAEEFARRGDESVPLLRSQVRRLEQRDKENAEAIKQFSQFHAQVQENAYKQALEDLRREKIEARNSLDGERELLIDDKIEELRQYDPRKQVAAPIQQPKSDPVFEGWIAENKWAEDEDAQAIGMIIGNKLRANGDTSSGKEFLDKIKLEMRKSPKYAHFLNEQENPNRTQAPAVGANSTVSKNRQKGYADLPADAKEACNMFVKKGFITQEKYVKDFFGIK